MTIPHFVEKDPSGTGYILRAGETIVIEAPDLINLADRIIDAQQNGLSCRIHTGVPMDDHERQPDYLTRGEHKEFWRVYYPKLSEYRNSKT